MKIMFLYLFLSLGLSAQAQAVDAEVCGRDGWGWSSYSWCAFGDTRSPNVVYYFHGNGESERGWLTADHAVIVDAMPQAPLVIAVSFGKTWFLEDSLRDQLVRKVLPKIENRLGVAPVRRMAFGESMGGFNALQLYFKSPGVFSKVVAACPAVPGTSPYASGAEMQQFLARNPWVNGKLFGKWRDKLLDVFRTPYQWSLHDPNNMAKQLATPTTALLLNGGGKDPFGFFPRTELLSKQLRLRGANVVWSPVVEGSHCTQTPTSLRAIAGFLSAP